MKLPHQFSPLVQVMREAGDVLLGVSKRIALYDRKRKQDEALKLQGLWCRWDISTFDYLMRVGPPPLHLFVFALPKHAEVRLVRAGSLQPCKSDQQIGKG